MMSETKHTPEPWLVLDCREIGEDALTVAANPGVAVCRIENSVSKRPLTDEDAANARRIVACVNACAGISQQYLEELNGETLADKQMVLITQRDEYSLLAYRRKNILDEVIKQRDEMLVALEDLIDLYDGRKHEGIAIVANARATIASVKGGAA